MPSPNSTQTAQDINLLSTFLSHSQLTSLSPPITATTTPQTSIYPSTLIFAPSAILHQATTLFTHLQTHTPNPSPLTTLVLTGGIGHSTQHLYTAILASPLYSSLPTLIACPDNNTLSGLAEARLLYLIFIHFHDGERVMRDWDGGRGLRVLVEEESTNCGANASLSRMLLERNGMRLGGGGDGDDVSRGDEEMRTEDVVIVQDPTMSLRTKASFEKVYDAEVRSGRVRFWCCPGFVPVVRATGEGEGEGEIAWDEEKMEGVDVAGLWEMKRFYGLILGEVSRLRDDEDGYGPNGKGFISHVDVPEDVQKAWERLSVALEHQR